MNRRHISVAAAAMAMIALILDNKSAMISAADGVDICIRTVIPSLFPFFILSVYLTGSLNASGPLQPLGRLFRVPRGCESILISTLLGGYPVGAQSAAQAWRRGQLSREQASRMLFFCSQAGPSFLFGMAASQFPGAHYGWLLWGIQLAGALSVAWLLPPPQGEHSAVSSGPGITLAASMKQALQAMASVCGWVITFRVIIGFLQRWILWMLPLPLQVLISGVLEITNGILMLGSVEELSLRLLLATLFLNFGGICVLMQTVSVCEGLDLRCYIKGKLLQTFFAALYIGISAGYWAGIIPLMGIFLWSIAGKLQKNSSIPAPVGV